MRRSRSTALRVSLALVLVAGGGVATPAWATDPSDAELRARAKRVASLIAQQRYDEAEHLIAANLAEHPDPFVFLDGVLHERRSDCGSALDAYRRYIDLGVPQQDADAAQAGIERCQAVLAAQREGGAESVDAKPTGSDAAGDTPAGNAAAQRPDVAPAPRWWADPAGATLTLGGAAVLAAGAVVWSQAVRQRTAAERSGLLSTYERRGTNARRMVGAGVALVSVGAAVLVAGAIRYAVVRSRTRRGVSSPAARKDAWRALADLRVRF